MAKEYFDVFSIRNFQNEEGEKACWTRIGTAFQNEDKSYNLLLDLIPCSNPKTGSVHVHMRKPRSKEESKPLDSTTPSTNSAVKVASPTYATALCSASVSEIDEDIL